LSYYYQDGFELVDFCQYARQNYTWFYYFMTNQLLSYAARRAIYHYALSSSSWRPLVMADGPFGLLLIHREGGPP
jgi:hypothetical protein